MPTRSMPFLVEDLLSSFRTRLEVEGVKTFLRDNSHLRELLNILLSRRFCLLKLLVFSISYVVFSFFLF